MFISRMYNSVMHQLERFDIYQVTVLMMFIVVVGFFLLKGLGPRSHC